MRAAGIYTFGGVSYHYHPQVEEFLRYHQAIGILDIAVAPLAPTAFNRCRSGSKWLEHSLHETAMVVSDLEPYAAVQDGVTALKAQPTLAAWHACLKRLITDAELRRRIGAAARAEVLRMHTVEAWRPAWCAWLEATRVPSSVLHPGA